MLIDHAYHQCFLARVKVILIVGDLPFCQLANNSENHCHPTSGYLYIFCLSPDSRYVYYSRYLGSYYTNLGSFPPVQASSSSPCLSILVTFTYVHTQVAHNTLSLCYVNYICLSFVYKLLYTSNHWIGKMECDRC